MFKKLLYLSLILVASLLQAEIIEITQIDEIRPYATEDALYLFDIDDTLIDTPVSLGSPPWRNWIKPKLTHYKTNFALYDALTLYIAKNAPYKTVEPSTAKLIADLQSQGYAVFAFTARGRSQWYTTTIEGVDQFTHKQLHHVGIDFKTTLMPKELKFLETAYFYDGIIFAQHTQKGDLLKHLFKDLKYHPSLIVFVDDKLDQVQSVEASATDAGIPFIGFWYRHSELKRSHFDPMLTNIQLESLLLEGKIMSDDEALELSKTKQNDPDTYFSDILNQIDIDQLSPSIF